MIVKKDEVIFAKRNVDLINRLFNKSYKAWMKCTYNIDKSKNIILWLLEFAGDKNGYGWKNSMYNDYVIEEYDDPNELYYEEHKFSDLSATRVAFSKKRCEGGYTYRFLGVLKFDEEKGTPQRRVWKVVADEFDFVNA